ncbi:22927_t:CDS:2 [Gigaspora margarita]|uniref:22927_t:CDS:1 n=1 Tax=Gigaspora margarita TaxID=4874 RepID=A0ABN7UPY0_GIGMA|nr:22927_t:CDS:2 [Gigaspora margarita]
MPAAGVENADLNVLDPLGKRGPPKGVPKKNISKNDRTNIVQTTQTLEMTDITPNSIIPPHQSNSVSTLNDPNNSLSWRGHYNIPHPFRTKLDTHIYIHVTIMVIDIFDTYNPTFSIYLQAINALYFVELIKLDISTIRLYNPNST